VNLINQTVQHCLWVSLLPKLSEKKSPKHKV
jgi:hypothetical protein